MDIKYLIEKYKAGDTISSLAREFGVSIDTVRYRLKSEGVLQNRRTPKCSLHDQTIIELYKQDVPISEIAHRFNVSTSPIVAILKKHNVRKPNWLKTLPYSTIETVLDRNKFEQLVATHVSQANLMDELGCGQKMIQSLFDYHGIEPSTSSMSRSLINQQKASHDCNKDTFIQLYEQEKFSLESISKMFGISVSFLRHKVKNEWNIPTRDSATVRSSEKYIHLQESPEVLRGLLVDEQKTLREVAEQYDCCIDSVHKLAKHNNIQIPKKQRSSAEKEIEKFIMDTIDDDILICDRSIIHPMELDLYIPSRNLAIEYNGLFWHSELYKDRSYHKSKTEACEAKGIRLIHIFEDEWRDSRSKCEETIKHLLGKSEKGVFARKVTIRDIPWNRAKAFLERFHLLGAGAPGSYNIGAFSGDDLVGVMVFGQKNNENGTGVELRRFVTDKKNNPGLGSKMFKYAVTQQGYKEVVAFVDRRWFTGIVKEAIGFKVVGVVPPTLWWTNGTVRYHRRHFTKKHLLSDNNQHLSKRELLKNKGFYRIWDSGKLKLLWDSGELPNR